MTTAFEFMRRMPAARPWLAALEWSSRIGYAARGLVYIATGSVAVLAAVGLAPRPRGPLAALQAWSEWPLGVGLLWLIGIGLYAFAGWRALQSLFDAEGRGVRPYALLSRTGQALSGVIYTSLAISVFALIDAMSDLHQVDDQARTRAAVEAGLSMPGGEVVVFMAGLVVTGCGIGNIIQAAARDFGKRLFCRESVSRRAAILARVGYGARGFVFIPIGLSIATAGLHARSGEAQGAAGALTTLRSMPFGDALLAFAGVGLIAFGLFALVEARYRDLGLVRRRLATLRGAAR